MNLGPEETAKDHIHSSSWIKSMLRVDPDLSDIFETFCDSTTYGEALQAVNRRLRDVGRERLTPERSFELLRFLRPKRFGPTVTMAEAFENRDIDPTETVKPNTNGKLPARAATRPKPAHKERDSKASSTRAQRTETSSLAMTGPDADSKVSQRTSANKKPTTSGIDADQSASESLGSLPQSRIAGGPPPPDIGL